MPPTYQFEPNDNKRTFDGWSKKMIDVATQQALNDNGTAWFMQDEAHSNRSQDVFGFLDESFSYKVIALNY